MTAADSYSLHARTSSGGPRNLAVVTPDDDTDLPVVSQWLYITAEGALQVTTAAGQTLTTPVLVPGWHPLQLSRVWATGTTATGLMVGW